MTTNALSEELIDALALDEVRYPVGTVRPRKVGGKTIDMIKTGHGEWEPVSKVKKKEVAEFEAAKAKLGDFLKKGEATVTVEFDDNTSEKVTGRLDPEMTKHSVEEHLDIAENLAKEHTELLNENMDMLRDLFPDAQVYGRVKTAQSAVGKLVRKPKIVLPEHLLKQEERHPFLFEARKVTNPNSGYATAKDLGDMGGMRAVFKTFQEIEAAVKKLKEKFPACSGTIKDECIVSENDYLGDSNPPNRNYPYRSYHLNLVRRGKLQEIQFRTPNQDRYGDWAHDTYKPRTPQQKAAYEANKATVDQYAKDISDYFKAMDSGRKAKKPPCPQVVRDTFGCL